MKEQIVFIMTKGQKFRIKLNKSQQNLPEDDYFRTHMKDIKDLKNIKIFIYNICVFIYGHTHIYPYIHMYGDYLGINIDIYKHISIYMLDIARYRYPTI